MQHPQGQQNRDGHKQQKQHRNKMAPMMIAEITVMIVGRLKELKSV